MVSVIVIFGQWTPFCVSNFDALLVVQRCLCIITASAWWIYGAAIAMMPVACGSKTRWHPVFQPARVSVLPLLHIFADRGLVDYDERVASYWPEFGQAGKESITVRQVMSHQSGLYHIRHMIDDASRMLDWEHMVQAIETATPAHEPGGPHRLSRSHLRLYHR